MEKDKTPCCQSIRNSGRITGNTELFLKCLKSHVLGALPFGQVAGLNLPIIPFCKHSCSNFVRAKTRKIADRYTGCVTLSSGWVFLIGGATGAVRVAIAKRFFEFDLANSEGVIIDEQRKTPVHITPVQRWLIVLAYIGVAIIGCFLIQHDGNWNPFPHLRD
jgi:hypothetical protein